MVGVNFPRIPPQILLPQTQTSTSKKSGNGLQNRPYPNMLTWYNPPPFYGSWSDPTIATVGSGVRKSQNKDHKGEKVPC